MKNFNGQISPKYLQKSAAILGPVKQASYRNMQIATGDRVLDLGCGAGFDVLALSEYVGNQGQAVGYDHDPQMLNQVQQTLATSAMPSEIRLIRGCASHLPFQDNLFDSCRSERLFMHLETPEQTLSEIFRVTRPGGKVVVIDTDWSSLSVDNPLPKIEQALSNYRICQVLNNGYSGRGLYRLFKNSPCSDINIEVYPIHTTELELFYYFCKQQEIEEQALKKRAVTERELHYWRHELQQAADKDLFYASLNLIMISAYKTE